MKKFISLLLCTLTCTLCATEKSSKESFFDTLNLIETVFHTNYAPATWKKEYLGWELGLAMQAVEEEILAINNPSIIDYQKAFSHFFASPKDYHVSIRFYSTAFSSLPFRIEEVEGRYFIAWKDIFSNIKLQKGDEILEINHRPVSVVIREFAQEYLKESLTATDCAIATAEFTFRQGRRAHTLPQGDISFLVTPKDAKKKFNYKMQWQHTPELFSSPFQAQKPTFTTLRALGSTGEKKAHNYFKKCLIAPLYTIQEESKKIFEGLSGIPTEIEKKGIPIGHRDSFIPPYTNIIWKSSTFSPFQAYIFKTDEDKKVGFLRIDSYMHEKKSAEALLAIIEKMEAETEALIVDQTSNPGGILFFMYTVASTLTDKPLVVPKEHQPLTQEQLDFALCYQEALSLITTDAQAKQMIGPDLFGYPVTLKLAQQLASYCRELIEYWNRGEYYTRPLASFGIDSVDPHPECHYTKHVILLINELDISCGDFLPAIFQDNNHATIVGTRTAGAGGCVISHSFPNRFGIESFNYTVSLAKRIDGSTIENLGVTPEIILEKTVNDLQNDYVDYKSRLLEIVNSTLK